MINFVLYRDALKIVLLESRKNIKLIKNLPNCNIIVFQKGSVYLSKAALNMINFVLYRDALKIVFLECLKNIKTINSLLNCNIIVSQKMFSLPFKRCPLYD
jgi:hypothetical protein